jgi:hypothetical protein
MSKGIIKFDRRAFAKQIGITTLLPFIIKPNQTLIDFAQSQEQTIRPKQVPEEVTGRKLTGEETMLAEKFLDDYTKAMRAVQARDLPHDLLPAFISNSPKKKTDKKAR